MKKPRLIYYNDAHHFNAKRIEPPASIHMLQWPVDEVLGTGVDLLVLGLGYGDVYFHDSRSGASSGRRKRSGRTTLTGALCVWWRSAKSWAPTSCVR